LPYFVKINSKINIAIQNNLSSNSITTDDIKQEEVDGIYLNELLPFFSEQTRMQIRLPEKTRQT